MSKNRSLLPSRGHGYKEDTPPVGRSRRHSGARAKRVRPRERSGAKGSPRVSASGLAGAKQVSQSRTSKASAPARTERGEGVPASERVGGFAGAKPPELSLVAGACSRRDLAAWWTGA